MASPARGLLCGDQPLHVRLLPPSHWTGSNAARQLLAAFVRPNDPAVDQTLRVAASKLESAHKSSAVDGYESGRKERVWEIAEGIWAAMVSYRITYVLPPASFEKTGQKVRGPGDILKHRLGTCLDTSMVFSGYDPAEPLYAPIIGYSDEKAR